MAIISESIKTEFNERAFGCIMGAFIGDSCGSYLEFYGGFDDRMLILPNDEILNKTMEMPGGGHHRVAPGQVTDDSELMQCLLWAYVESNENVQANETKKFDLNKVGNRYGSWYNSGPFDIGQATSQGLKSLAYDDDIAEQGIERARAMNGSTKSNGSMMRCMPHAIFGAELVKAEKYDQFKEIVSIEASFVHPNPIVHEGNFVYLASMAHLLNNPNSPTRAQDAYDLAVKLASSDLCQSLDSNYGEKIQFWLQDA
jgi:ADP-ribosylglycohydrolase